MNSLLAVKSIDRKGKERGKKRERNLSSGRNNNDSISVPRLVITQSPVSTLNFDDKLLSNHDNIRSFTGQNKLPVIACVIKRRYCFSQPFDPPRNQTPPPTTCNPAILLSLSLFSAPVFFLLFFFCFISKATLTALGNALAFH